MKSINYLIINSLVVMLFIIAESCTKQKGNTIESTQTLFRLLDAEESGISFSNQLSPSYDNNIIEFNYFYNGGGVALGDVNNDGKTDVFFTGNMVSSALYLNQGDLKFEEVTNNAGLQTDRWATGATMVDINEDGLLDIYVCFSGLGTDASRKNSFYINQGISEDGQPVFKDMATETGLADIGYSTQAAFFDYDKDGDLDAYILTAYHDKSNPNFPKNKVNNGESPSTDRLYRNDGLSENGLPKFTNVSSLAGITFEGYGLGIAINDINGDGWEDIYVANDFIYDDLLYINQGNGSFKEEAANYLKHQSRFSMGCDIADVNNDNLMDIVVLDMLPADNHRQKMMSTATSYEKFKIELNRGYQPQYSRNIFQLNKGKNEAGKNVFSEVGYQAGIYKTDWSWSPLIVDLDNDGYRDLFITNGIPKDITNNDYIAYRESHINPNADYDVLKKDFLNYIEQLPNTDFANYLYRNNGWDSSESAFTFTDMSKSWGFDVKTCSNGAGYADLDNDGDLDLVINNVNQRAFVYENTSKVDKQKSLRVRLHGTAQNLDGIGSTVSIKYGDHIQSQHQSLVRGFQSSQEPILHFGLGNVHTVDQLEIIWPDGKQQVLKDIATGQVLDIYYKNAQSSDLTPSTNNSNQLLTEITNKIGVDYAHAENDFDEFKAEFLLPHLYSKQGPGIAVGDINGDELEDFVIGGSLGKSTLVYKQTSKGKFTKSEITQNANREDMGLLLFDCDNDSDLDLYIVSGGSEYQANTPPYQDRLMLNDGKGNFELEPRALPKMFASGSCVTAADYDKDGDLDLFVGGRIETGRYPQPVRSYILRNEGGKFSDVTLEACREMFGLGLVTSAIWTDFDNDQNIDLIVVGEWMALTFFKNQNGRFINVTENSGIQQHAGWWNSLAAADFDKDGDIDYIAGNLGLNSKFQASVKEPVQVYAHDFDDNGSLDPILTKYTQGVSYPVAGRDELISQMMIYTRKKFPRYDQYADVTINDLFSEQKLNEAYKAKATYFKSAYVENLGNGQFKMHDLPAEAQTTPVYGILVADMNTDGNLDILLTGNSYSADYMSGQYDASYGQLLTGDGNGKFKPASLAESGFMADGDRKSLTSIHSTDGKPLVFSLANNGKLKAFSYVQESLTSINIQPLETHAELNMQDGSVIKEEFYYGVGYLSQASRILYIPKDVVSVKIFDSTGKNRIISMSNDQNI
ncbi:MAG: RNA-binding protein [Thalassobius sp.]|nr:RNA-binding protein [Thalassovita sp.]